MGNRGMTNWKIGAFFIMSLMLVAAVFSNAAMAQGPGKVGVAWQNSTNGTGVVEEVPDTFSQPGATPAETVPMAAGSKFNALQFTYTAFTNVRGTEDEPDEADVSADVADDNDTAIDMAGGRIRIAFPSGWTVSKNYVQITEMTHTADSPERLFADVAVGVAGMIYKTVAKGKLDATFEGETATAEAKAAAARVSISGSSITIKLGKEWRRNRIDVGRSLVIVFSDVQAGLVADGNEFRSSANARGGNLRLLAAATQPSVKVGNILGSRTPDVVIAETTGDKVIHADPLSRSVEIEPKKVYPGEKKQRFTITFTAPGPMNVSTLSITIPEDLRPDGNPGVDDIQFTEELLRLGDLDISVLGRGGREACC